MSFSATDDSYVTMVRSSIATNLPLGFILHQLAKMVQNQNPNQIDRSSITITRSYIIEDDLSFTADDVTIQKPRVMITLVVASLE